MWLYCYFPQLYLETWYSHVPSSHALALYSDRHKSILDCNSAAHTAGVQAGMNLHTTLCLAPTIHLVRFQEDLAKQAIEQLRLQAQAFSSWFQVDGQDGLYLEVGSMQKLLGAPQYISQRLQAHLKPLTCQLSSAPYARTARLLARSGIEAHLNKENIRAFLNPISIDQLSFDLKTQLSIKKLGIKKFGQLLKLRTADIAYRINLETAQELEYIAGYRKWLPKPEKTQPFFYRCIELDYEANLAHQLLFPLSKLIREFCQFLTEHCLISHELCVRCIHRETEPSYLTLTLANPTQNSDEWLYLLRHALERFSPSAATTDLQVFSKKTILVETKNLSLIQPKNTLNIEKKNALMNRLSGRIGPQQYGLLSYKLTPLPEQQTELVNTASVYAKCDDAHPSTSGHHRPIWIIDHPKPIHRQQYHLLHGPERLDQGWWQATPCRRDYYIAQHQQGAIHWLYKDAQQRWFLQGYFS